MSQITEKWLGDQAVSPAKIKSDVAGNGLQGGAGSALSIKPDVTTGAGVAPLSSGANGAGLAVDDVTIDHSGGTIGVKDAGIDTTQLANDAVDENKLDLSKTYDFKVGGGDVKVADTPATDSSAVNKGYVDNVSAGLRWKDPARAATTAALPACTYANGTAGVGATLTGDANGALPAQDGITLAQNERLLVKDQANGYEKGLYALTQVGDAGTPFILTRVVDFDEADEVVSGAVFVSEGSTQADTGWTCTADAPITMGTTALPFTQFNGAANITAGAGLTKSGNTLNVGDANKGIQVNADDLEIDGSEVAADGLEEDATNSYQIRVKVDATGGANLAKSINRSANGLAIKIDDDTIGENGSNQLYVKANSIGAAELDETDTYDFSASGSVDVATQAPGNNTTKAASTAFVQAAVAGMSTETKAVEYHKVTAGEVTAGYFTLASNPTGAGLVEVTPVGGPQQVNKQKVGATGATPDFDVLSTNQLHFNNNGAADGLSEIIAENDILMVEYPV